MSNHVNDHLLESYEEKLGNISTHNTDGDKFKSYYYLIEYRIVMRNKSSEWLDYIELKFDSISLKCLENMKTVYQDEKNLVLDEKSVEWKPCINRESKSLEITI